MTPGARARARRLAALRRALLVAARREERRAQEDAPAPDPKR